MSEASPFSFHCMICVEQFHQSFRYPVVLPCGHTYVCNHCAEKLDRCMECRTPLTIPVSKPPPHVPNVQSNNTQQRSPWASARSGTRPTPPPAVRGENPERTATECVSAKRLPLPKNVVLLSLMEATEITTENEDREIPGDTQIFAGSEDEDEKIRVGTSLAIGACGTYAVVADEGLQIFPTRPSPTDELVALRRHSSSPTGEEDVDTLVRFFHLDHDMDFQSQGSVDENSSAAPLKELPPVQLNRGDRIQIVSVEDGWAKLARGYGYVRSGRGRIAKVGGSVDRACSLEALLRALSIRRKELKAEQSSINTKFVKLMNELQSSLVNDDDLTVVGADNFNDFADSFSAVGNENPIREATTDDLDDASDNAMLHAQRGLEEIFKPSRLERQSTPPILQTTGLSCFSPDVLDPLFIGNSSASIFRGIRQSLSFSDDNPVVDDHRALYSTSSHPSPRTARVWREQTNAASRGIDFQTGLSGHMALLSSHAHSHDGLRSPGSSLKMSSHSGLTVGHSRRSRPPPSIPLISSEVRDPADIPGTP